MIAAARPNCLVQFGGSSGPVNAVGTGLPGVFVGQAFQPAAVTDWKVCPTVRLLPMKTGQGLMPAGTTSRED